MLGRGSPDLALRDEGGVVVDKAVDVTALWKGFGRTRVPGFFWGVQDVQQTSHRQPS